MEFYASFFFNDTATTEIYTLSLHDALPISGARLPRAPQREAVARRATLRRAQPCERVPPEVDRKSTRLNSSHGYISYAVFCLKKKKSMCMSSYSHAGFVHYTCPPSTSAIEG